MRPPTFEIAANRNPDRNYPHQQLRRRRGRFHPGPGAERWRNRGEFRIALSGGNTPRPIYAEFGRIARDLPWEQVRFTFGDERCVPPDDEESNYRMARESLFTPQ